MERAGYRSSRRAGGRLLRVLRSSGLRVSEVVSEGVVTMMMTTTSGLGDGK